MRVIAQVTAPDDYGRVSRVVNRKPRYATAVLSQPPRYASLAVDQHDFRVCKGFDANDRLVLDRRAVARRQFDAPHLDLADGRDQVEVATGGERPFGFVARLEGRSGHARLGPDRQGVVVAREAAGQRHELAGAVALREGLGAPGGFAAAGAGLNPD